MDNNLNKQIYKNMELKPTEELQEIFRENDRDQYSNEAFEAIRQILNQREGNVPEQKERYNFIPINSRSGFNPMIGPSIVGALLGGIIAFLLRPSAPFIGQLPFEIVILRGTNLKGLDQMLLPIAQKSFNILVAGVIIGIIAGACIGHFINNRR